MSRFARITLTASALSLAELLAGCESFDPTSIFDSEIFNTKKKLPGERRPVFPEGTPGVPQGVPQELVKGYQPPAEPEPQQVAEEPEKPARQSRRWWRNRPSPSPATARPPQTQQSQGQPAAGQWPGSAQPSPGGGVAWPDPPSR
jgi:hypothetical protein